MRWYNPKTRSIEERPAPATDMEVEDLLGDHPNSEAFIQEYLRWRSKGRGIEEALVFASKTIQDLHLRSQPPG